MVANDLPRCNSSTRCSLKHSFNWYGQDSCKASFVCLELGGNICGDYGLIYNDSKVCVEGQLFQGTLGHKDQVGLELWHVPEPDMGVGVQCYFWCSVSGEMGQGSGVIVDQSLLESLVRNEYKYSSLIFILIQTLLPCCFSPDQWNKRDKEYSFPSWKWR
jgi:hypothetical protein